MESHDPEIEKTFASVTKSVLGRALNGHGLYGPWLLEHVRAPVRLKSAVSGQIIVVPSFSYYTEPGERAVTLEESLEEGKKMLGDKDIRRLTLANAPSLLSPIKLYSPDVTFGTNLFIEECGVYFWSSHCYASTWAGHAKYCAYSMWPRNSEGCFGCEFAMSCKSCLKCYHSVELSRCFEVSHSNSCSDCFFCHNCENLSDSMFCFNAKGMKYAIGNVEVGKERYEKVKALVLADILKQLEKNHRLDWNVFNIGGAKKTK